MIFCLAATSFAEEKPSASRGEIRMIVQNGGQSRELRYRYTETQLRIDRPGEEIPSPPVNLLDREKGTLSIIHPHNRTYSVGGVGEPAACTPIPAAVPEPSISATTRRTPPADGPGMPGMPENLPEGMGPDAEKTSASSPQMPGMPSGMPAFPAMPEFPMEGMGGNGPMALVPQNQTNELFGFSCRLYALVVPGYGTLQLWLCDDPALPPFHLLRYELPRGHHRPEWDEQVADLLRKEKVFPFRAELKGGGGDTLAEWRVLSFQTHVKEKDFDGLFMIPAELHLLPAEEW